MGKEKTNNNTTPLNKSYIKSAISIAIPSMVAFMTNYAYQLVDTYWVSQLGKGFPTAMLIATVILRLFMSLNQIVSSSTIPIFSQTYGSGDKERTGYVILQGILFKLALGLVAGVLYLIVANNFMFLFTDDAFVIQKAKDYANIIFMTLIVLLPYGSMLTGLRSINEAPKTLIISIVSLVFNLIFDPILIYGIGFIDPLLDFLGIATFESMGMASFMQMGIKGAALATVLTQILGMIVAIIILLRNKEGIKVFQFKHLKFDKKLYIKMATIGIPAGGVSIVWNINQFIITSIITGYGVVISDGYGIAQRIRGLFFMGMFGLSLGSSLTVGKYIGAGRMDIIQKKQSKLALVSVGLLSLVSIPMFILANQVIGLFTDIQQTVEYGSMFLRFFAVMLLFVCARFIFEGAYKGAGRNLPLFIINFVMMLVLEIPVLLLMKFVFQLDVFYLAVVILVANALNMIGMFLLFKSNRWMKATSIHD
jgi:putative MATE family efflux protein